jgi:aryl-alcohol dehydrogenase-like predicted oxidoreductase
MIPYCLAHGIGIIPWGPLHSGDLARQPGQSSVRNDSFKGTAWSREHDESDKEIIRRVGEVASKKGWKNGQVALAWIKTKITSPIVGVSAVSKS